MLKNEFVEKLFQFYGASQSTLFQLQAGTRPEELTQIQYDILELLYFAGEKSLSQISNCLYLAMPNASREVRKLTDKGYLKKIGNSEDKRRSTIVPTELGNQLMHEAFAAITANANNLFAQLTENDQDILIDQMVSILSLLFKVKQ